METTALSLGKSVLAGALGYAKSAFAEEVALQFGIQRDHAFIRDELEMMLAFLVAAHDEQDKHLVVKTWVKQVRNVAYDAEDSIQDFTIRLGKPSWWRILHTLVDRHHVAKVMKELRAKVEDVSQRNMRYHLIKGSGSKATTWTGQSSMVADATMFGINEARSQQENEKMDLFLLISNRLDKDLKVIAVWGTNGIPSQTVILKRTYDDVKRSKKFEFCAWIKIMHPFHPTEFLRCIMRQFYIDYPEGVGKTEEATSGAQVLKRMARMRQDVLVDEFHKHVSVLSYLIVLHDLSSIEEWDWIKTYFTDNNKGCRIIVSTDQHQVASLCLPEQERVVSEVKQSSAAHNIYAFHNKGKDDTDAAVEGPSSNAVPTSGNINSADAKVLTRKETMMAAALSVSQHIGRENEKTEVINMLKANTESKQLEVITICGMGGLGKTTLVTDIYQSQDLRAMINKRACITIKRPFNLLDLLGSLLEQLNEKNEQPNENEQLNEKKEQTNEDKMNEKKDQNVKEQHNEKKKNEKDENEKNKFRVKFAKLLSGKKSLIVIDDLSSITEWDNIKEFFPAKETIQILITTREENIAKHCSEDRNIYRINFLGPRDACDLFTKKVFGEITNLKVKYPELAEEAKLILKKCNGLPLAIVTIGGFLSKLPQSPMEWKKLNEHIGAELEMNQHLGIIKDVLIKSYDGLTYQLKSCFLYMSIFPGNHNISRRRLVRRWIAEGYSSSVRGKSDKDIADGYFMDLIDRSMILPCRKSIGSRSGIDSCQVHDLMREISISKAMEENLVFIMEEGCSSTGTSRHLSITSNWEGDQQEFENLVDLSRVRSLTVFGRWKPFFISNKMRLLRVLDLEDTSNLFDHHLERIGILIHLKFLSLRGCGSIFHLPNSLGNLQQLQTLDIRGTRVAKLPQCIIKLRKLQYINAGGKDILYHYSYEDFEKMFPKILRNKICLCAAISTFCCVACFASPQVILGEVGDSNSCDMCTWYCHTGIPFVARLADPDGIVVPKGLRKLRSLYKLGIVNIARGKSILQELKCLTQLCKLSVTGINRKNYILFCSIFDNLSCLESLSVISNKEDGLHDFLDYVSSPPRSLQSLKLYGKLVKLPKWIGQLQNLVKLKLMGTWLSEVDGTLQVLGKLKSLAILHLSCLCFEGTELCAILHPEAFPSLVVLDINHCAGTMTFGGGAMPKLELLRFDERTLQISGLGSLPRLKEVMLKVGGNIVAQPSRHACRLISPAVEIEPF